MLGGNTFCNPCVRVRPTPSTRPYRGLPELDYPFHDKTIHVTHCRRICLYRKKINFSTVFAGQAVGIKEVEEGIGLVSFMGYDLRCIASNSPLTTAVFSVAPRHTPKTCFSPPSAIPNATTSTWPPKRMPSIISTTTFRSSRRRSHSTRNWLLLAATNCRLTLLFSIPYDRSRYK
jgi:hypothetical protein